MKQTRYQTFAIALQSSWRSRLDFSLRTRAPGDRHRRRLRSFGAMPTIGALCTISMLSACAPEVGSARWCEAMRETPAGDWSANEALDYGRYCVLDGRE
jgi:hypothetical protein